MGVAVTYWHPFALRRPMREIAARYPVTYRKVGEVIAARGFNLTKATTPADTYEIMVAILAAMPPHVIPYGPMGDDTPWGENNWAPLLADLLPY